MSTPARFRSFFLIAGLIAGSFGAWAETSLVHITTCTLKAAACTISTSGSGNLIVIGWQMGGQSAESTTIGAVIDNAGNIYRKASASRPVELPNGSVFDIWYTTNSLSGATSLTVTAKSGIPKGKGLVWEFSGVDPTASIDQFQTTDWAHLIAPAYSEQGSETDRAGKTVPSKTAASASGPVNACDINQDGRVDVLDGQSAVNVSCASGICNGGLAPQVINASLGGPCAHSVLLTWTANPAANVAGYNIYRGTAPGGPFAKVNFVLVSGTSYTDATVEVGKTYYYVATTVDTARAESGYSNTAFAAVPAQ